MEVHTKAVIFGYSLLISTGIAYKIIEEQRAWMLMMLMSGIIMLILSNYVKYREKAPYNVVLFITVLLTAFLAYQVYANIVDEELLLAGLMAVLSMIGSWSSTGLIRGRK